jgi:hypothetical protein
MVKELDHLQTSTKTSQIVKTNNSEFIKDLLSLPFLFFLLLTPWRFAQYFLNTFSLTYPRSVSQTIEKESEKRKEMRRLFVVGLTDVATFFSLILIIVTLQKIPYLLMFMQLKFKSR